MDFGPGVEVIHLEDLLPLVSGWAKFWHFVGLLLLPSWLLEAWVLGIGGQGMGALATVIFSSGSTGDPKGVMLTHDNIAGDIEGLIQWANLTADDRMLGVLPFFHSFGYTVTLWAPLQLGASTVYHPDPRAAREIGELCKAHGATMYLSTATFLRFSMRKCEPDDFKSLRLLICGAEKLPPTLAAEFEQRFAILPIEGYGCTELSPVVSTNLMDQPCGGVTEVFNRTGTVGMPFPGVAARTVHPDTREWLPAGAEGLLAFHGPNVMAGYLNRPDLTAAAMKEGWYVTGDVGRVDADGFITLTGRLSRFAKVAGEMVPLEKIEEALHDALPAAERACVVSCVPDDVRGERVVVLYLPAAMEAAGKDVQWWLDALATLGLPNLWIPARRDFVPVEEIPLLGTGKIDLKAVTDLAMSLARK
jgi:acyl-[acyl-carrier-protein]-phospholipid O-acyltransferase/long-chain-fatty-acid--[acyl-carrier-protein] ligase